MGNIREKPDKTKDTEVFRHKKLTFVKSSMIGWRQYMEDVILSIYPYCNNEDMGLFAIFDGHGGPECSQYAGKYFPDLLKNNQKFKAKKYEEALTETFLNIDELMRSKDGMKQLLAIREKNVLKGNAQNYHGNTISGTTANVCLLTKQYVYVANVGDSRGIAILRGTGAKSKYKALSRDHKPQLDIEKERILKAGGTVSQDGRINNNLNLSRALGDFFYKNNPKLDAKSQIISAFPDVTKTSRAEISHILMGCDGIWETKSNEEMFKWFKKALIPKNATLKSIIESLFNQLIGINAEQENGLDNMSAIIIQI